MEYVTAVATGVVSKIGELLVEPIGEQLCYLIRYDDNINSANEMLQALKDRKEEVLSMVDVEKQNGREIVSKVEHWLKDVDNIEALLRGFCENEVISSKKCLGGWCPNLTARYSLSKRAKKMMDKTVILKKEEFKTISTPAPLQKLSSIFSKDIKGFESRKSIIKDVIEKLKDERFKRISICGMGGVGKTTLAKEVIKIVEAEKLFDEVVFTVVSQNPDLKKIQDEIADRLGLKFDKSSLQGRSHQLLDRINKTDKTILIVLDDVWTELDFESIGLPSDKEHKSCKFMFTSRNEGTCHKMGSQKTFTVNTLSREESWDLFREIIGNDLVSSPDIHPIARDIANECGGLPIALVTVGKALVGNKEKYAWDDALDQLRKSSGSFTDVEKCIELSCNLLDDEKAKLFLYLCCLFPEDTDIPIEVLMWEGWGLGLIEDQDSLWKVRNKVHTLINNLRRRYLLLDSNKVECVKMHDVVRDVVISIASSKENEFKIQCDAEKKWQEKSTWDSSCAISSMIDELKEWPIIVECPKLELLQMASKGRQPIPIKFFQGMSKLKVLSLLNLGIQEVPSLFQALNNLRTLRLEDCQVEDVSIIGKELLKLEILSFAYSNIKELPIEIGQLGSLRLLNMTGCDDLNKFSSNVLTSLSKLEEFYFRVKNFPWMHNNDILIELQKISHQLKVVEIRLRKVELFPKDLIFENVVRFWVYVVPYFNFNRRGCLESNILQLTNVDYNSIVCSMTIKHLVKRCEILRIENVKNLKNVVSGLEEKAELPLVKDVEINKCSNSEYLAEERARLPLLNNLSVKYCSNLMYLIDCNKDHQSVIDFSNLMNLKLIALPSLIGFSNTIDLNKSNPSIPQRFNSATELADSEKVEDVNSQVNAKLFTSNWMKQLKKLETILLEKCISIKMVFDLQAFAENNGVLFPQLKEINISYLDNLTHVWGNVPHCVQGFQNLRSLTISRCDSIRYVFTPAIVKAITNLEKLEVSYCKLMENVVAYNNHSEEDNNKELEWPSLREFNIVNCPMLEICLLPTYIHAKRDNLGVTYDKYSEDDGFHNFKGNNSKSSNWHLGCMPFLPKYFCQGSTDKGRNKEIEVPLAEDKVPTTFEMKRKIENYHMPILEDLYVRNCDLLDVLFWLEEPSYLKSIKIEWCDTLKTIVAKREESTGVTNSFAQLESLCLDGLPNLVKFCFSRTYEIEAKHEDMGACEADQRRIKSDILMDGSLFPNLTSISIGDCNKINILFSHSSMRSLERLEKLEVWYCMNMEEIVSQEEIGTSENKIMLPRLQHLLLRGLTNLKAYCQGSCNFCFPSLRKVEIKDCPNMEVFSRGTSDTPKLEDVSIEIKPHSSNYIQKKDLNATIQGFKEFVALQGSDILRWSQLNDDNIFGYFIKNSEIEIKKYHKLMMLVPLNEIQMLQLQRVRKLTIEECDSLVKVFELEGRVGTKKGDATAHYELEEMTLEKLPELRHIWKPNITGVVSFQKLMSITIENCHSLKSLLSYSMGRHLVQLQYLEVYHCNMMEEIVTKEEENIEGSSKVKILFPKLKSLDLVNLPNLQCVCSGDYDYDIPLCDVGADREMNNKIQISFPQLEEFNLVEVPKLKCFSSGAYDCDIMGCNGEIIEECPNMATFPHANVTLSTPNLHHIWTGDSTIRTLGDLNLTIYYIQNSEKYKVELQKLETFNGIEQDEALLGYVTRATKLALESCHKLLNCIPSNMSHLFSHLEELIVRQCGNLEEIFESNDYYKGDTMWSIELDSLPKLKHIWKNHGHVLGFQKLRYLTIKQCHDLKYVFLNVSVAISIHNLWELVVSDCNKMEEIIQSNSNSDSIQPKEAKIIWPRLYFITLEKLPSLNCFSPSSYSCYIELSNCRRIIINECPEMETFCYGGTLYTPYIGLTVENTEFGPDEEVNEVIRHRKWL